MSVAYVSQSQAKPGGADNLREFFRAVVAPAVRGSHGCESFNLLQSDTDPSNFMAVESWASVEAHRASVKNIPPESIVAFMQLVAASPHGSYYHVL